MGYYIGIDLGTSSAKMVLMDSSGSITKTETVSYPVCYPQSGWAEQNPEDWYYSILYGLEHLFEGAQGPIEGLGVAGQMHGLVLLDENDQVIRPAILWNDGRAAEETVYLNEVIGRENLLKWTGNIAYAGFSAPKLLWVKKHEPEAFRQIAKIMLPKDYLVYKLTGAFSTDPSDASGTLFFDVDRRCWSEEMLEICGIQEHMLPKVYESYEPVGHLKEAICDRFGLGKVVVAAGAGDNAAAAIGTGTVDEGTCTISLGTSGTVFIPTKQNYPDKNYALHAFAHATGEYHLMGCILCAAACGKWWMEEILETNDYVEEQADIQRLGENPIYFLPYMMGERSPHNDPSARGVFLGLSLDTTRAQMTQSIYEGVAFALRDNLEIAAKNGVSVKKARLCGGGAKSPLWRQIIADVLNIEIEILEKEEGPSSGAAILAAVACGAYSDVSTASRRNASITEIVRPDTDVSSKYDLRYGVFKQLYPKMKEIYQLL